MSSLIALQQTFLDKWGWPPPAPSKRQKSIEKITQQLHSPQQLDQLLTAKGWFINKAPEIDQRTNDKIGTWRKENVKKLEEEDAFIETPFKYGQEEAEKIAKHRKWEKIALCVTKVITFSLLILGPCFVNILLSKNTPTILGRPSALPSIENLALLYDELSESTLRARKARIVQDTDFDNFVDRYVVRCNTDRAYPNKEILLDRELHLIFYDYKEAMVKARNYLEEFTPAS